MDDQLLAPPPPPETSGLSGPPAMRPRRAPDRTTPRAPTPSPAAPPPVNGRTFGIGLARALEQRLQQDEAHADRDLRRNYLLTAEVGTMLALLILIGLFHLNIQASQEFDATIAEQETVQMEEIITTKQETPPPPPPRPMAPVVVADDTVIDEDLDINLDATLDIGEPLETLPPPPPEPEPTVEEEEEEEDEIFVVVEEMPELIGGIEGIQARIQYPDVARLAGIEGRVFVQFVVDENGNAIDPVVVRGIGGGCDEEAIRAVKEAKFKPGRQRGKPVKVRYSLPVLFKLK